METSFFNSATNIIKVNKKYFNINIKSFISNVESFNNEINKIVNYTKKNKQFDIDSNWCIELPLLKKDIRRIIHTFQRKNKIKIYSIGQEVNDCRIMIVEPY